MLNSNRIKRVVSTAGSLTIGAGGSLTCYDIFGQPINGEVVKVEFVAGNYDNGGSIGIVVSGTGERIWNWVDADTSVTHYVKAWAKDPTGAEAGSPYFGTPIMLDGLSTLYAWMSGCTAEKSGGILRLYYR